MNTLSKNSDLIYEPNHKKGEYLHDGLPCPTESAYELLGDEGVLYIQERLKEMLEWRKVMYGAKEKSYYGFSLTEYFISVQNRICFAVGGTLANEIHAQTLDYEREGTPIELPKLIIPEEYTLNNFEKLHQTNHFIINDVNEVKLYSKKPTIPDYYRYHYDPNIFK